MYKVLFLLIFLSSLLSAQESFSINNFSITNTSKEYLEGLRLQGTGDFFYKNKSYVKAVPFYQQALQLIPTDADITFRLANSYQHQKLWRLAILYYEETIKLLQLPQNFQKSQLNRYISQIKIAQVYYQDRKREESRQLLSEIRKELSLLESLYPEALKELEYFDNIYPINPTRQVITEE